MPAPVPIRWLGNGHLQTIYNVLGDFSLIDNITYSRTLLRTPDGGTLGLDFVHNPDSLDHRVRGEDAETRAESEDTTPILVIAHGLTGGSYESYVRCANARPFVPGSPRPLLTVGLPPFQKRPPLCDALQGQGRSRHARLRRQRRSLAASRSPFEVAADTLLCVRLA